MDEEVKNSREKQMKKPTLLAIAAWSMLMTSAGAARFQDDVRFLSDHVETIVLRDATGASGVAVVPAYQGRVMTSSANGDDGLSLGWINHEHIASGKRVPHINVFGGEDRFWMGPEGGQYSLFFKEGDPFDLPHWQTPPVLDTEAYDIAARESDRVLFTKGFSLTNYSGTVLSGYVEREVKLLDKAEAATRLAAAIPAALDYVGYHSKNTLRNTGLSAWDREGGLPSIWILGMFNPSEKTTIVIPFQTGPESELGPVVNDAYFGKVPKERLVIGDGVLYFSGDGTFRSKIGLSPQRAKPVAGSYDALNKVLTIVQYTAPEPGEVYVNSMWEIQEKPYAGDVVNSYNDGPPEPGKKPLGPFYELETSSPAAELEPGETLTHVHRTFHFQGEDEALDAIARTVLGVGLQAIENALP